MNSRGPTSYIQIIFMHIILITVTWLTAGSWHLSWRKNESYGKDTFRIAAVSWF